jgi:hypothetical protein
MIIRLVCRWQGNVLVFDAQKSQQACADIPPSSDEIAIGAIAPLAVVKNAHGNSAVQYVHLERHLAPAGTETGGANNPYYQ